MKYSAAEKAIGNLNERRAFQVALHDAMALGTTAEDVNGRIIAIDAAIEEIKAVMPAAKPETPKKPRTARKAKKDAAA